MSHPHDAFEQWQRRDQLKDALAFAGVAIAAVWLCVCVGAIVWLAVAVCGG